MTEFRRAEVHDALTRLVAARGSVTSVPDLATLLLLSNGAGWAIRVVVTADGAKVGTGMGSVIPIAADEDHASPVVEVVGAIINGDAEEYSAWATTVR